MKICLVSHTENFKENEKKYAWLIREFKDFEKKLKKNIPITWALEEDETKPFNFEIRAGNKGDLITEGAEFFKKLKKEGHELGIHIHFVKGHKVDFSYENQNKLIKDAKQKFVSAFGFEPKSFVGGWWHSDERTLDILEKEGFLIDASPMPLYSELRRRWIFGKVPFILKLRACDWRNFSHRTPVFQGKILRVPNAVDPKIRIFSRKNAISLDSLDIQFNDSLRVFKSFIDLKINFLCIPFHPHYLTKGKVEKIKEFLIECNKIEKLSFITLKDIYKKYKNV